MNIKLLRIYLHSKFKRDLCRSSDREIWVQAPTELSMLPLKVITLSTKERRQASVSCPVRIVGIWLKKIIISTCNSLICFVLRNWEILQVVHEEKNLILNLTIDVMFLTVSVLLYRNSHLF